MSFLAVITLIWGAIYGTAWLASRIDRFSSGEVDLPVPVSLTCTDT